MVPEMDRGCGVDGIKCLSGGVIVGSNEGLELLVGSNEGLELLVGSNEGLELLEVADEFEIRGNADNVLSATC